MEQIGDKVSYVRKPFAKRSVPCLLLGLLSVGLFVTAMYISVRAQGNGDLSAGAFGFSSMAACLMALWYAFLSILEKECNYLLARIGFFLALIVFIVWAIIIVAVILR